MPHGILPYLYYQNRLGGLNRHTGREFARVAVWIGRGRGHDVLAKGNGQRIDRFCVASCTRDQRDRPEPLCPLAVSRRVAGGTAEEFDLVRRRWPAGQSDTQPAVRKHRQLRIVLAAVWAGVPIPLIIPERIRPTPECDAEGAVVVDGIASDPVARHVPGTERDPVKLMSKDLVFQDVIPGSVDPQSAP